MTMTWEANACQDKWAPESLTLDLQLILGPVCSAYEAFL